MTQTDPRVVAFPKPAPGLPPSPVAPLLWGAAKHFELAQKLVELGLAELGALADPAVATRAARLAGDLELIAAEVLAPAVPQSEIA